MRIYSEVTNTNPIVQVNNRHCQLLLEDRYLSYLETRGFPTVQGGTEVRGLSDVSTVVYETKHWRRNFEIVEQVFAGFCDYLAQTSEEHRWTFDNLIAIIGKGEFSTGPSRLEVNLLKNTSNKVLMYYLSASKFRSSEEYSNTDVNLHKDVLMKALNMADLSTDASSISWLSGVLPKPWSVVYYDSVSDRIQQVLEKPWREIQQTYLKILSELREMPGIHLEKLSQIPSRALYFCFQQQILRHLPIALDIIEESFSTPINEVKAEPEKDSETGEEWLEFKIRIEGEIEEVLSKYDKYTERLVSLLPWSARYKMRLSYNII